LVSPDSIVITSSCSDSQGRKIYPNSFEDVLLPCPCGSRLVVVKDRDYNRLWCLFWFWFWLQCATIIIIIVIIIVTITIIITIIIITITIIIIIIIIITIIIITITITITVIITIIIIDGTGCSRTGDTSVCEEQFDGTCDDKCPVFMVSFFHYFLKKNKIFFLFLFFFFCVCVDVFVRLVVLFCIFLFLYYFWGRERY
jgi:hypothetical protein